MIGPVEVDRAVLNKLENNEKAASPGMKYKHYAPRARVILVRGGNDKFITFVNRAYARDSGVAAMCYDEDRPKITAPCVTLGSMYDEKAQAQALFDALRAVDEIDGVTTVYAHCPSAEGVGMALYNRLIRAAAFEVIDLPSKRIIGLTGQTGAGKSSVAEIFSNLGLPIVSADNAARLAVEDSDIKAALCAAFGDVLDPDGSLDRALTAKRAFSSPKNTAILNAITHPRIIEIMIKEADSANGDTVVFDASQLFESGEDKLCDRIIGVIADKQLRLERLKARDNLSDTEIERRMSAQLDEEFFIRYCDDIISNNGTEEELRIAVKKLYEGSVIE